MSVRHETHHIACIYKDGTYHYSTASNDLAAGAASENFMENPNVVAFNCSTDSRTEGRAENMTMDMKNVNKMAREWGWTVRDENGEWIFD